MTKRHRALNKAEHAEYNKIIQQLTANPIARANAYEIAKSFANIYETSHGDIDAYLKGIKRLADHLDALNTKPQKKQPITKPARVARMINVDPAAEALECGS